MRRKILVTGGVGYIGSHTVVELYNAGYEAVIVDNLSNSKLSVYEGICDIVGERPALFIIDCCNRASLEDVFTKHPDIEAVIHFAAFKSVNESIQFPLKYYENNIGSLTNVIDVCLAHNCNNIVFSSSCTVYGQPDALPVTEETPFKKASSPYGETKQMSERLLAEKATYTGSPLKVIALRYFNPVGAHKSAKIGELPLGVPQNLVPYITQTAAGIRDTLYIFGNDYDTPDGTCIRDYIYVQDLAKAHISALNYLIEGKAEHYEVINIGTGHGVSVLEMVKIFQKVSNIKLNYKFAERRSGDIEKIWADSTKAERVLGWRAEASLEDMLSSAWRWQQHLTEKNNK